MIEFKCNVPNERTHFPKCMGKECQWWTCSICKACLNHCDPKQHEQLLKQGSSQWDTAVKRAGGHYVRVSQNTDIRVFGVLYKRVNV